MVQSLRVCCKGLLCNFHVYYGSTTLLLFLSVPRFYSYNKWESFHNVKASCIHLHHEIQMSYPVCITMYPQHVGGKIFSHLCYNTTFIPWKIKIPFAPKLMSFETRLNYDNPSLTHSKLLERLKCESESKNNERKKNWGMFLNLQHFGVRRVHWSS